MISQQQDRSCLPHPALAPDRLPAGKTYVTQEPRSAVAKTPGSGLARLIADHWRRFIVFSLIGASGLAVGVALQGFLQRAGLPSWAAFSIQAIVLIQAMFAANRLITWRNRRVPPAAALARWNAQRIVVAAMSLAVYWLLARAGAPWGAANAVVTVAFTPVQYAIGHAWSFASYHPRHVRTADPPASVSVLTDPMLRGRRRELIGLLVISSRRQSPFWKARRNCAPTARGCRSRH